MAGYDGAGTLFALGLRLTKIDATGAPIVGTNTCYVTDALVQIAPGLTFTENEAVTQNNGRGQPCVSYQAPDTLLNGVLDPVQFCTPDPHIMEFLVGGAVILTPSEVQTVTITGSPTGGTYTLTFGGQTTAGIAWNATSAAVRSALEALSNIAPGDVVTAGGPHPGADVAVTFGGAYAGTDVAQMTASAAGLTGGTTPAVVVTTTTPGGSGDAIGYRAPEVNTTPVPNGVAIEAWTNAILDNAPAMVLPYFHHIWPRCRVRLSENVTLGAENAGT
ncbi:MAG: hypothetical protein ACRDTT_28550, partial [Pseudonocardiaceae bacterium]